MPEATPQQIALYERTTARFQNRTRPRIERLLYTRQYCQKLQALFNDLGVPFTVWTDSNTGEVEGILDIYNRLDRCFAKVQMQVYGVRFVNNNTDFDIMAPPHMNEEQIMNDEIILMQPLGAVGLIIIGVGLIVAGLTWKVVDHLDEREKTARLDVRARIAEAMAKVPELAPQIQSAIEQFKHEEKDLSDKAGLTDLLFGSKGGVIIAAALGIGVLLFAFMKGRK